MSSPAVYSALILLVFGRGPAMQTGAPAQSRPQEYQIQVGDQLDIKFFYNPELNEQVIVRPDGRISLQLIPEVLVTGLTPATLTQRLTEQYATELRQPRVTVIVRSFGSQRVFVDGEVGQPGMLPILGPLTVMQAVAEAGGMKDSARATDVIVIRRGAPDKPVTFQVNLKQARTDPAQDVELAPFDIVYVPRSRVANVNTWVDQYIRKNIPLPFAIQYRSVQVSDSFRPPGDSSEGAFEADSARGYPTAGSSGLREILRVLFKRQAVIVVTFVTVVATVAAGSFLLSPTYRAQARVLLKIGRENVYRPEVVSDQNQVLTANSEEIVNSETSILTSRDLTEKVVSTIGVDAIYPDLARTSPRRGTPLDAAVETFSRSLSVEGIKKSNVIEISFEHKDPRVAAKALNLLVDAYKEKHLQAYSDPKSSYLEQQLASYQRRLNETQQALETFKQQNQVFSLAEQRSLLLKQRADLDAALKATDAQVGETRERIASVTTQLATVAPRVSLATEPERYRSVDEAKAQLLGLQLKEADLLRRYSDTNELVVNVRKEIAIVQAFITTQEQDANGRMQTGQNIVHQDLERDLARSQSDLASLQAKAASLGRQIGELDRQIPALDVTETTLENLKRDVDVNDRNYRIYVEKVEDARILEDLNRQKSANISVIEQATVPVNPVKPRKLLNVVLAVFLGLFAGLALAFAAEFSAQGVSTPEAAEQRLGLPVLATVALKR